MAWKHCSWLKPQPMYKLLGNVDLQADAANILDR